MKAKCSRRHQQRQHQGSINLASCQQTVQKSPFRLSAEDHLQDTRPGILREVHAAQRMQHFRLSLLIFLEQIRCELISVIRTDIHIYINASTHAHRYMYVWMSVRPIRTRNLSFLHTLLCYVTSNLSFLFCILIASDEIKDYMKQMKAWKIIYERQECWMLHCLYQ